MADLYARLSHFKAAAGNISDTGNDAEWVRIIERASRRIDTATNRSFVARRATRYFDAEGGSRLYVGDLVSIETIAVDDDGDGVYDVSLTASDYWLWPDNAAALSEPYLRIDLHPNSSTLTAWPRGRRTVEIVGIWGYSYETEDTLADANEDIDGTETAIDVTDGTLIERGEVLKVDSEQLYVASVAANTITVTRAYNGTTAATHSNGVSLLRRRYPRDVEQACALESVRYAWETQTGYQGSLLGNEGWVTGKSALYPMIRDLLGPYVWAPAVVA